MYPAQDELSGYYNFFMRKECDWFHYLALGEQARVLAKAFYETSKVVKRDPGGSGQDSLSISSMMLNKIMHYLLVEGESVRIWEKSTGSGWSVTKVATPGNVEAVESMGGALLDLSTSAKLASVCISETIAGTGILVGVAIAHASMRTIKVYEEFQDTRDLSELDVLLVQNGVKECIAREPPRINILAPVLERCGVARVSSGRGDITSITTMTTTTPSVQDIISEIQRLQVHNDEVRQTKVQEAISGMSNGLCALHALLDHLDVWRNVTKTASLTFEASSIRGKMLYDMTVAQGLSLFPGKSEAHSAILRDGRSMPLPPSSAAASGSAHAEEMFEAGTAWTSAPAPSTSTSTSTSSPTPTSSASAFHLHGLLQCHSTPMGGRLMTSMLQQPSANIREIRQRHDVVGALALAPGSRSALVESRACLKGFPDLGHYAARLRKTKTNLTLSDLLSLYMCFQRIQATSAELQGLVESTQDPSVKESISGLLVMPLEAQITAAAKYKAIVEELVDPVALSAQLMPAGVLRCFRKRRICVRPSFTPQLAQLHCSIEELERALMAERDRVAKVLKLDTKKDKGVYLEESATHGLHLRVTKKDQAKLKQLKASCTCSVLSAQKTGTLFVTSQFAVYASRYKAAMVQFTEEQAGIVRKAIDVAVTYEPLVRRSAELIALVDCLATCAEVAVRYDWVRPIMVDTESVGAGEVTAEGRTADGISRLSVRGLRHPMLHASLGSRCIASDFTLGADERVAVITGPNMGGKSTFMRAVALCSLLAQMGSFVPAAHACLPVVDRIFVRMGAGDSSTQGLSTFLTEMKQMNGILSSATRRSLVLIDELGRGTSTHDGFGIAWAVLERLRETGCMVLFATHFLELTALAAEPGTCNYHVTALVSESEQDKNDAKDVVMLYSIEPGVCEKSFGIHVARAVDFPTDIVEHAERLSKKMQDASTQVRKRSRRGI